MFRFINKNTQKSHEFGSKFKIKIPAQYQIWCVYRELLIFISFTLNIFNDNLNMLCFIIVEFTERQVILTCFF